MKFGYYRLDESMHSYLIPEEEIKDYDELDIQIEEAEYESNKWYGLVNLFIKRYDHYRIDNIGGYKVVL